MFKNDVEKDEVALRESQGELSGKYQAMLEQQHLLIEKIKSRELAEWVATYKAFDANDCAFLLRLIVNNIVPNQVPIQLKSQIKDELSKTLKPKFLYSASFAKEASLELYAEWVEKLTEHSNHKLITLLDHLKKRNEEESLLITPHTPFLNEEVILNHNMRAVCNETILEDLEADFLSAQFHLDDGHNFHLEMVTPDDRIATESFSFPDVGVSTFVGKRSHNEDAFFVNAFNLNSLDIIVFGVCDGHGKSRDCADFFALEIPKYIKKALTRLVDDGINLFAYSKELYAKVTEILSIASVELGRKFTGQGKSTLNYGVKINHLYFFCNAGDSRSILIEQGKTIALSEDAKPSSIKFREEVIERGGVIVKCLRSDGFSAFVQKEKCKYALNMTSGVGHDELGSAINPRCRVILFNSNQFSENNQVFVTATDGLWDVMSSNQTADLVQKYQREGKTVVQIADQLLRLAFAAGSSDNITIVVASFNALKNKKNNPLEQLKDI